MHTQFKIILTGFHLQTHKWGGGKKNKLTALKIKILNI